MGGNYITSLDPVVLRSLELRQLQEVCAAQDDPILKAIAEALESEIDWEDGAYERGYDAGFKDGAKAALSEKPEKESK